MAGGYSRSPVPRSLTSALERLMVSSESMMKWTRSSCTTHSCKLAGRSMGVSRSMFTNRVATYSQRTGGLIYSPKVRQAPPEPQQQPTRTDRGRSPAAAHPPLRLFTFDLQRRNHFPHSVGFHGDFDRFGNLLVRRDRPGKRHQSVTRIHINAQRRNTRFGKEFGLDSRRNARVRRRVRDSVARLAGFFANDNSAVLQLPFDVLRANFADLFLKSIAHFSGARDHRVFGLMQLLLALLLLQIPMAPNTRRNAHNETDKETFHAQQVCRHANSGQGEV